MPYAAVGEPEEGSPRPLVCLRCGTLTTDEYSEVHEEWHLTLEQAHVAAARGQVVTITRGQLVTFNGSGNV